MSRKNWFQDRLFELSCCWSIPKNKIENISLAGPGRDLPIKWVCLWLTDWLTEHCFTEHFVSEELQEDSTQTRHSVLCLLVAPQVCSTIRGSLQSYILNLFALSTTLALAWRLLCLSILGTAKNKKLISACLRLCGQSAPCEMLHSHQFAVSTSQALGWRLLCLSMLGTARNKKLASVCLRFCCGLFAHASS